MILFEPSALNPKPGFCQNMSSSWGKDLLGNEGGGRGGTTILLKNQTACKWTLILSPRTRSFGVGVQGLGLASVGLLAYRVEQVVELVQFREIYSLKNSC